MDSAKGNHRSKNNQCHLCQLTPGHPLLCHDCYNDLPWLNHRCPICALPRMLSSSYACGHCQKKPPAYRHIQAAFHYHFPLNELINQAKFEHQLHYIPLLAELLLDAIPPEHRFADLIVPVPMHWKKLKKRRVNHALLLARELGKRLSIPVADTQLLQKVRHTEPQKDLTRQQRQQNLRGSFAVSGTLPAHVALVDDVMTTGATIEEIARLLIRHQVQKVDGWVIARTPA